MTDDYGVLRPSWGHSGSPVIYNDIVLLTGGENGIAVNKKNGKLIWASNLEKIGSLSSPHLLDHSGKKNNY